MGSARSGATEDSGEQHETGLGVPATPQMAFRGGTKGTRGQPSRGVLQKKRKLSSKQVHGQEKYLEGVNKSKMGQIYKRALKKNMETPQLGMMAKEGHLKKEVKMGRTERWGKKQTHKNKRGHKLGNEANRKKTLSTKRVHSNLKRDVRGTDGILWT